ncbi:unnamed protein product [Pseudo-nitzschia multistriata]|uniref:Uncharacterized protein n=1 Tax=Pseudo-nitzschia multistriata TaxID=183589 RepID=A0A448Z8C1_9STRA|nr:unnamed protein product [Pseudo-nitzschia multistriata]
MFILMTPASIAYWISSTEEPEPPWKTNFMFFSSPSVNSVDVSEGSGTGEGSVLDLGELFVGVPNFLRLGVKTGSVNIGVIDTIFLSSGNTEFEFKKDVQLGELFHVVLADADVLFEGFLGKIEHVGGEKRLSVLLVELLVFGDQTVHPWQPSLLAVVGVEDDRNSVKFSDFVDVLGGSDGSSNGGLVVGVVGGLSGDEVTTSLREGNHDGASILLGGFHAGIDGRTSNNVYSWDGESFLLGVVEKVNKSLSGDNTRLDRGRELGESLRVTKMTHLGLFSGFSGHVERGSSSLEASAGGKGSGGTGGGKEGEGGEFHFAI